MRNSDILTKYTLVETSISPLKPDSKRQYTEYFSELQASNIANQLPIFDFNDKLLNEYFARFLKLNKFLWKFQNIEKQIFIEGRYAVGLDFDKLTNMPVLKTGKVIDYSFDKFKMVKLKVLVDTFDANGVKYSIIEEYDLTALSQPNNINTYAVLNEHKFDLKDINYSHNPRPNRYYSFIPWVIFQNRPDERSDIDLVNNELFLALDHSLDCYWRDGYLSSPFIFILSSLSGTRMEEQIKKSIYNLNNRVFTLNNFSDMFEDNAPVRLIQASSQGQLLIQKINEDMARIEKFMFGKRDTKNFGTKNLQTTEVENINSDFEDYYEYKANLREDNFRDFVEMFIRFIKEHNNLAALNYDPNKLEVVVCRSTKWQEIQRLKELEVENKQKKGGELDGDY